jgi:hypothetical protein
MRRRRLWICNRAARRVERPYEGRAHATNTKCVRLRPRPACIVPMRLPHPPTLAFDPALTRFCPEFQVDTCSVCAELVPTATLGHWQKNLPADGPLCASHVCITSCSIPTRQLQNWQIIAKSAIGKYMCCRILVCADYVDPQIVNGADLRTSAELGHMHDQKSHCVHITT